MDRFPPSDLLFEIPVYRLAEQSYYRDLDSLVSEALTSSDAHASHPKQREAEADRRFRHESVQRQIRRRYGRRWTYNEMIGVIRLYQDDGAIKGELWRQPHKRFRRNFKHHEYEHWERVVEWHPAVPPAASADVYGELLGRLTELSDGGALKGRYVDLHSFRRIGPHTDWLAVLGWGQCQ